MQSSGGSELPRKDSSDNLWAGWASLFECRCLQFCYRSQLVRKWVLFKPTGDDFRADYPQLGLESPVLNDEDDEDGKDDEAEQREDGRESSPLLPDFGSPEETHMTRIYRQSETLRNQNIDSKDYRIAVGTWNLAGRPPPDELSLDEWLGSTQEADIYVLGFQEIVPLNAANVLCIEDEGPSEKWEILIRGALNSGSTFSVKLESQSAPQSPWRDLAVAERQEIEADGTIDGAVSEGHGPRNAGDETTSGKEERLEDWTSTRASAGPRDEFHSFLEDDESLQSRLYTRSPGNSTASQYFSRDRNHSIRSRFIRIASKQMAGLFLTVWIRTGLRRHVHSVQVSCIGCGLMGYLGNKGSISVSMSLHQTSFCFICSHLTSGDTEDDKYRRNTDAAETLKRTAFPRSSELLRSEFLSFPETITSHDCVIWLGDLNYRLALPDQEVRALVALENWEELLEADELKIEQDAGRAFDGWLEGPIDFAPTYKYIINSEKYTGECGKSGEKRRTPAWCDRILYLGRQLRMMQYHRTESRLSDHRPVSAFFTAEVERFS